MKIIALGIGVMVLVTTAAFLQHVNSASATSNITPEIVSPAGPLTRPLNSPLIPMGSPGSIDDDKTGPRVVVKLGNTDYRMYYEAVPGPNKAFVGYATSTDGKTWVKQGLIPSLSPSASWEGGSEGEVSPNSILIENGVWKLWYHSYGLDAKRRIGYATSPDGINWTKRATPVLDVGSVNSLEGQYVVEPRVFNVGSGYRMYYTANAVRQTDVGTARWFYATSNDGVNWTRRGQLWSKQTDNGFGIVFDGSRWHAWYGLAFRGLAYASSVDGLNWVDGPSNPVLTLNPDASAPDSEGVGDSVSAYRDGDEYRVMYTGGRYNSYGRNESICLAVINVQGQSPTPTPTPVPTPTVTPVPTPTPSPGPNGSCTPVMTVTDDPNMYPGGPMAFSAITSSAGAVTVDHVNEGTGLQTFAVVRATNAMVTVPPFSPGTFEPVAATFTVANPALPVDFTLRATNRYHGVLIQAQCGH